MNIKENIVCIKTATKMGSGIIYKCENSKNNYKDSTFIIFTNKHLVADLEVNDENLIKCVHFDIYNKYGEKIPILKDKIKLELFYHGCDKSNNKQHTTKIENKITSEDIAAFLLTFNYFVDLELENRILWDDNGLDRIYMEGFPQILSDNEVSSKLQLEGKYKDIFPANEKIGVFQIKDDYHWYSNYKDLRLFQGFSGGPVYSQEDNGTYLVGMNQSLLNINDGENPFKLLYYYKIRYILEYLRELGCIIFNRNSDNSVSIRWIHKSGKTDNGNITTPPNDNPPENNISLLLLGASGAGKSSFAKTFLLHSKNIDSTNDGQTTRTNIIYNVSLNEENPRATIKFLNQEDFTRKLEHINQENYILTVLRMHYESEKNKLKNSISSQESVPDELKNNYSTLEELSGNYSTLKEFLRNYCILDDPTDNTDTNSNIDTIKEKIKDLIKKSHETSGYKENIEYQDSEYDIAYKIIDKKINQEHFVNNNIKTLIEILRKDNGFFNIEEFAFLFDNCPESIDENIWDKIKNENYEEIKDEETDSNDSLKNFWSEFKSIEKLFLLYYQFIYRRIINKVKAKYDVKSNNYQLETSLFEHTDILTKCLQVKNNESLTGIVDYVEIRDKVSNDYSFIFDDLEISSLKMIDTYGLDHKSWENDKNDVLKDIIYNLIEKNFIRFDSDSAIAYIKKLDSGKPTELKSIISQINNIIPQSPIYCILNGLDIFAGTMIDQFVSSEILYSVCGMPKSIDYLKKEAGADIVGSSSENGLKSLLYNTLKNNIVSFCSNSERINKYFNLYDNNRREVYKILLSVRMKEYSSMNIIPEYIKQKITSNVFNDYIDDLIENLFKRASKTNWKNEHPKTRGANITRISKHKKLGYWGTYRHQWNQLFHEAYTKLINDSLESKIANWKWKEGVEENCIEEKYISSLGACIRNIEPDFLGASNSLIYSKLKSEDKSEFRNYLEKMYLEGYKDNNTYAHNPFDDKNEEITDTQKIADYLNDVCNFSKGLKYIKDDLRKHFNDCLIKKIDEENAAKSKNLLRMNPSIIEQLNKLKNEFNEKYPDVNFNDLMNYYYRNTDKSEDLNPE